MDGANLCRLQARCIELAYRLVSIAPLRAINPAATVIPLQADIVDKNGPNRLVGRGLARLWKINNCGWVFVRVA